VLALENIELRHGGFSLKLDHWRAEAGQFHALLGCNGAGKSTLLKLVAGELPYRGRACLHERELDRWNPVQRARHLAVLPQASQLNFGFTAAEVVALGATPLALGWRELQTELRRAMDLAQCGALAKQSYPRLSGGEKQRVHLARCLLQLSQAERAPLLLLDEPTSAQDLGQQHTLLQRIRELCDQAGYGVVAVLHDLNHALRYAQHASLLDAGRLVADGEPADLLTPSRVQAFWGYGAEWVQSERGDVALL
jgi:iron complex transport system ATP-binding protein